MTIVRDEKQSRSPARFTIRETDRVIYFTASHFFHLLSHRIPFAEKSWSIEKRSFGDAIKQWKTTIVPSNDLTKLEFLVALIKNENFSSSLPLSNLFVDFA